MSTDTVHQADGCSGPGRSITIVIPCYNEAQRLDTSAYVAFLTAEPGVHLVFVNDGSTDSTSARLAQIEQQAPDRVTLIELPVNQGKGGAVRSGILAGLKNSPCWLGYWDADLATPLTEVSVFADLVAAQPYIRLLCGSRILRMGAHIQRHWYRHYPGRIIATCISLVLGLQVYDTQCGAKLIEPELAAEIFAEPFSSRWLFDVELIARIISLVGRQEAERIIYEYPLSRWTDVGESKISLAYLPRIPIDLLRIYRRYHRQYKP